MPPPPFREVAAKHGRFLIPARDVYVGRSLEVYGQWCEAELDLLLPLLRPGDVVVDGGANIGAHAVPFAAAVGPAGRVWAVEPQPRLAECLAVNAHLNGAEAIRVVSAGLTDAPGALDLPEIDYARELNFGGVELDRLAADPAAKGRRANAVRVSLQPLDDLLALPRLRLLKLDVERMELRALRGARATIRRTRPILYLENDHPEDAGPLLEELGALGYAAWWHPAPLFDPRNARGEARNLFASATCVNLLAAPEGSRVEGLAPATGPGTHPRAPRSGPAASPPRPRAAPEGDPA